MPRLTAAGGPWPWHWDRLDSPRLRCILRRVRQDRVEAFGVVGQGWCDGVAAFGVVGERWCDGVAAFGVVGEGWCDGVAAFGVVGQGWCDGVAAFGVVGQGWCDGVAAFGVVGQGRFYRVATLGQGGVVRSACCLVIVPWAASTRFAHLTRQFSRQTLPTIHDRYASHLQR